MTGATGSIDNGDNGGISEWSRIAFNSGEGAGRGTTGVPESSTNGVVESGVVESSVEVGGRCRWTCGELPESMWIDNGEDAGTGLQECRGSLIGTRIWMQVVSSEYYDCTAEPRRGR